MKAKTCSRKAIKKLIQADIEGAEFHKPKRVNESERVSIKESRVVAIQLSETANEDCTSNMKTLHDAAVLQSSQDLLNKQKKWLGCLPRLKVIITTSLQLSWHTKRKV